MAIKKSGVSSGPCSQAENAYSPRLFDDAPAIKLQPTIGPRSHYVLDHARFSGTIEIDDWGPSDLQGMTTVPANITDRGEQRR
jgi:hypothetical protein